MDNQQHFSEIASESLSLFDFISTEANKKAATANNVNAGQLASVNTLNDTGAITQLDKIATANVDGYLALAKEPAISRIVVIDDSGEEKTFYISRGTSVPLKGKGTLASYQSPLGRLASFPVGEEVKLTLGGKIQTFEILEKVALRPSRTDDEWDSLDSVFTCEDFTIHSVDSFRALLGLISSSDTINIDIDDSSAFDALLGGTETLIIEGIRHQVRSAMALRDQPILDQFQDEIFRLPLRSQLIILGPPGTGKTTTLIKRLSQKLSIEHLDEIEHHQITQSVVGIEGHKRSWLMFTPTDLLKHFVKEAFSREQVPVSSEQIKTWDNYRSYLGRNILPILQSSGSSGFILKEGQKLLISSTYADPTIWFDEYISFHHQRLVDVLVNGLKQLHQIKGSDLSQLTLAIEKSLQPLERGDLIACYRNLHGIETEISDKIKTLKSECDSLLKKALVQEFNKNNNILTEFANHIDTLQQDRIIETEVGTDEDEDENENIINATPVQKVQQAFNRAIRSLAISKYQNRSISKKGLNIKIVEWLGDRIPNDDTLQKIGLYSLQQRGLRTYQRASIKYIRDIPNSYRAFRRNCLSQNLWYDKPVERPQHIESAELDLIVLAMLKSARQLLKERFIKQNLDQSGFALLNIINSTFRNQILVDEATDFSPLQLACMEALTVPEIGSFFACGDFNQRITQWGTRSESQFDWISNRIETRTINTVYRQSRLLNDFAEQLLEGMGGDLNNRGILPNHMNHIGVAPVLAEHHEDIKHTARWLKDRITEVERSVNVMPTIAILVNTEDDVKPLAEALSDELEDLNLRAVPCSDGQSLGEGNDVRVFDLQHIKGLEFEAVFFVGVDTLAASNPELFEKYLYVGATRAATYFGVTCTKDAPKCINDLRDSFISHW